MDIKRIHEMIETLTEVAKCEFDKGIENIDTKEMGEVADMIKDLSEAMYYRTITVAMEDSEYGVDYDWEGRKGYRGQMRDSKGRYMRKRYTEPMYMMPEMQWNWDDMEYDRDMDKHMGKMYYTEPMTMPHHTESGYDRARRGYEESKAMHKDNSPESKQMKMKSLEDYTKELATDITDMVKDMSAEEKNMLRAKLNTLAQKVQ